MFNQDNFPMEKYIIHVAKDKSLPSYFNQNRIITVQSSLTSEKFQFDLSKSDCWPSHKQLNMDEAQFEAFQFALTSELAIIQGPPGYLSLAHVNKIRMFIELDCLIISAGTGKTYVGLKIVETLLNNFAAYNSPILVVCYTNHALDQFLDGIRKFCTQVARIGGQNSSKKSLLRHQKVIGVTTTGAAKHRDLIQSIAPAITGKL